MLVMGLFLNCRTLALRFQIVSLQLIGDFLGCSWCGRSCRRGGGGLSAWRGRGSHCGEDRCCRLVLHLRITCLLSYFNRYVLIFWRLFIYLFWICLALWNSFLNFLKLILSQLFLLPISYFIFNLFIMWFIF